MCHSINCEGKCRRHRKRYLQRLVRLQVLVGSASLWEILLTVKCVLEKQTVRFFFVRRRFTAIPFRGVNYCRIYSVDLAKDVLKLHSV